MSKEKALSYIGKATRRAFMKQMGNNGKDEKAFVDLVQLLNDLELLVVSNVKSKAERVLRKMYSEKWNEYIGDGANSQNRLFKSESYFAVKNVLDILTL